jgi:hypothetical protein
MVGTREMVARIRDAILETLKRRSSLEACDAIRYIISKLPQITWLKQVLLDAQTLAHSATWAPPTPSQILELASQSEVRLVQSGEQLIAVILESLERLQKKLHGETPTVFGLWNELSNNKNRPKDENRLSDHIKNHLDEDIRARGIVVNREVEIRSPAPPTRGQRTDIHVDAVIRNERGDAYDVITVIIEVKGCWHRELKEAMRTQLVDRYLAENQSRHGIYLIGWFNCDQWDDDDYRKADAPKWTISEAQERFDAQAAELSRGNLLIRVIVLNAVLR